MGYLNGYPFLTAGDGMLCGIMSDDGIRIIYLPVCAAKLW